jgi:hypothetical protein
MPLEGHWARQNTPVRALAKGERRLVAWLGGAIAVLCVAAVAAIVFLGGSSAAKQGCIEATIASTTGGARYHACGKKAVATCRAAAAGTDASAAGVRAACRRAGIAQ